MSGPHPSHQTRCSDASTFDTICVNCGATDEVPGGWGDLVYPCPNAPQEKPTMTERDAFVQALAQNEDDEVTRLIFADWLEEHGEEEEAQRMRQWKQAKKWLVDFCERHNPSKYRDWVQIFSYQEILVLAQEAAESGELGFHCGSNMSLMDALRDQKKEFWKNVSIVLGIPLDDQLIDDGWFGCAC